MRTTSPASADAYVVALRMLARRELSEAQIRQRLARRGHQPDQIEAAVARLRQERAIDDDRVAGAIARTQTTVNRRGRLRVRRQIEAAGIAPATARAAVEEAFEEIDEASLLDASLSKRLREGQPIADQAEFSRLYRYLVGQGFESDRVIQALGRRRRNG